VFVVSVAAKAPADVLMTERSKPWPTGKTEPPRDAARAASSAATVGSCRLIAATGTVLMIPESSCAGVSVAAAEATAGAPCGNEPGLAAIVAKSTGKSPSAVKTVVRIVCSF
jgi:hypothetical protein